MVVEDESLQRYGLRPGGEISTRSASCCERTRWRTS
jgi:hypothetical protein